MEKLKDLMISISEFKIQLSSIIRNNLTKVIVKNNEPVAVIQPYSEYIKNMEDIKEKNIQQCKLGQDITLDNGVQVMVCVSKDDDGGICTKTYVKMKTSGNYKLLFTHRLGAPSVEETLTIDELRKHYFGNLK